MHHAHPAPRRWAAARTPGQRPRIRASNAEAEQHLDAARSLPPGIPSPALRATLRARGVGLRGVYPGECGRRPGDRAGSTLRRAARREELGGTRNPFGKESEIQTLMGRDSFEEERDEGDVENEIIDFYADIMSRASLVNRSSTQDSLSAEGIHAAFRNTIVFTDGFFQNVSRGLEERSHTVYSQSEYNTSQISKHGAEERASTYRKLVGIEENEAESDGDDKPRFTNPFADPPVMSNRSSYLGSHHDNPRASPVPISPRTTRQENKSQHKPAPHHRRPKPQVNPFARKSHVAQPEDKHGDRVTRFSDFT
ncbi:hypothetical protein EYC84_007394 [Monilinia fructicola]|uniref:Uncharacterized protein n=1 Tax=Monilinia fructicola TaxID=38448 RepID=A0A5M9JFM4_MONFR|nr:hypothetical protein EYC84_007394 [Monilinia fructicola]